MHHRPLKTACREARRESSTKKLLAVKIMLVIGNRINYSAATFLKPGARPEQTNHRSSVRRGSYSRGTSYRNCLTAEKTFHEEEHASARSFTFSRISKLTSGIYPEAQAVVCLESSASASKSRRYIKEINHEVNEQNSVAVQHYSSWI